MLTLPGIVVSVDEGGSKEEVQVLRNSGDMYCAWEEREIKNKRTLCNLFTDSSVSPVPLHKTEPSSPQKPQSGTKGMGFAENKANLTFQMVCMKDS